jgi:hypothetical protein
MRTGRYETHNRHVDIEVTADVSIGGEGTAPPPIAWSARAFELKPAGDRQAVGELGQL